MSLRKRLASYAWTTTAIVVAVAFFAAALSNDLYNATSPPQLSWHVALRKTYSIVAFAIVGALFERAAAERGLATRGFAATLAIGAYSGAIEFGQFSDGSHEGPLWNAIDVACGALGGALATLATQRAAWRPAAGASC